MTWDSYGQDGSDYGIYGQLFDGNGTEIGNEFRANNFTTNTQLYPSVASLSNGNFVVTWQSLGQDGSGPGVYGQIFNDLPVSSSKSKTETTSSTTLSVSSNTMSAIGRTRTSVNPSSKVSVPSTTRPTTPSNSRATLSASSDPSNRFSWILFLLGGVGARAIS